MSERERKPKSSKKDIAIRLLKRAKGCSKSELEQQLNWQSHSIRALLSTLSKELNNFDLIRFTTKKGYTRYRLTETGS